MKRKMGLCTWSAGEIGKVGNSGGYILGALESASYLGNGQHES